MADLRAIHEAVSEIKAATEMLTAATADQVGFLRAFLDCLPTAAFIKSTNNWRVHFNPRFGEQLQLPSERCGFLDAELLPHHYMALRQQDAAVIDQGCPLVVPAADGRAPFIKTPCNMGGDLLIVGVRLGGVSDYRQDGRLDLGRALTVQFKQL